MVKLNLASGNDYREGYINIDNGSMFDNKRDKTADVKTLEWEDNSVDEILLNHFMMYVDTVEAPILFKRWHGWLKSGGNIIIETGDLKKIALTITKSIDPKVINGTNAVMQLFGWGDTKGHTWAWCFDTLRPILEETGFRYIGVGPLLHNRPERDINIIAKKI